MRNKNKKTIPLLEIFEERIVPSETPILFDFEDQIPNIYSAPVSLTKDGLTIEISSPGSVYGFSDTDGFGAPSSMGKRILAPSYVLGYFVKGNTSPLLFNFSKGVSSVSIDMGDLGDDNPDILRIDLYSQPSGGGTVVGSKSLTLPHKGEKVFTSVTITATANFAMSAKVIGGTPEYPTSTFLDNLKVVPALGSISGRVSLDQNGGKSIGISDPGVPEVMVYLDANNNGFRDGNEIATQTTQNGNFLFNGVTAGTINLRAADSEGRKILLPAAGKHEFKLALGETRTGVNLSLKRETILKVVGTTPAPGTTDTKGVSTIKVQFNSEIDPGARWGALFSLVGAGPNGKSGDTDDLIFPLVFQSWNASSNTSNTSNTMELKAKAGWLPKDSYTFTALDNLVNVDGNSLDGEYLGQFPTGNDKSGGAFSYQFTVTNTPPIGTDFRVSALQNHTKIIRPIIQDNERDLKSIEIVKQPAQGTLVPTSIFGEFLYTPKPGFSGMDGFRLRGIDPAGPGPDFAGTIAVAAAPVDFRPTSLVVADPATIAVGKEVTFTWTVANAGMGTTLPSRWSDEVYLSHDGKWDQDDLKIASFPVNIAGIGNGASYKTTKKAVIPFGEWAGDAYFLLRVNTDQGQLETQTSNNELATTVKLLPAVSLVTPEYSFLGRDNPFTVKWRDAVPPSGGQLTLVLDTDNIPTNGKGSVELKRGISAAGDGSLDKIAVTIPSSIKDGKYFLWASLDSPGGRVFSKPVPVQVFQNAFVGEDERSDATGGRSYEVFGVDLGISQGVVNFRVRTNYSPTSNGGEIYINVGGNRANGTGKTVAMGVRNRTNETGQSIQPGAIYQGSKFQGGTVHKDVPVFAESYTSQSATKATLSVTSTPDRTWQYEINGSTTLEALGAKPGDPLEVGWGMYCGNDFSSTDNETPPEENDRKNLLGAGFVIKPAEDTGEPTTPSFRWGTTVRVDFSVVNQGNAAVDATRVRFVLSPDSTITKDDLSVELSFGSVNVPALPVGQSFDGSVEIKLPETPPKTMDKGGNVVLGMIVDSSESVAESDENDNLNRMGFDKAELRVGRAKVVNVLIHGYTPPNESYKKMEDEYRDYRNALKSFSESQPKLKNQVEGYVTEWESDNGFTLALLDVALWHLIELVKNGNYIPDVPGGLDDAKVYVNRKLFEYFVIGKNADEFQDQMLLNAKRSMLIARQTAFDAAYRTVKDLRDPNYKEANGISLLGPPEEGQWIHVIGHSRGGAVGAEVVRQLTAQGYKVGKFTALDGFSVDWPDGDKIQDLDILGAVRQGSATKMVNYQVEEALITEQIDNIIKDKFNEYLSGLLGEVTDISLTQNLFVDDNGQPLLWKAPSRAPLFDDVLMDTNARLGLDRSNHLNITDYFFTLNRDFVRENPYQAMLDGVSTVRTLARQGASNSIKPKASNVPTWDTFTDGNFENAGQIQKWKSTIKSLGKTGDKTVDALFQRVERPSFGLENGLYMDGQGSLVQSKTNTLFQIVRSEKAYFREIVQLSPNARYLGFKVTSLVANLGDELKIISNGKVTGRVGLNALVGKGFITQWFDISEYAGQSVTVGFEVVGGSSKSSKLQIDDLQILANDPGMLRNRPRLGVLGDITRKQGVPSPIAIPLKIFDVDTPLEKLTINFVSDNPSLLPNTGIKLVRNSEGASLLLTPLPGATGSAGITIAVRDGANGPDKTPFIVRMHFQLVIQPKDTISAPGNLQGSVRSGGVNLAWTTPTRFPEKGITDYLVQFRNSGNDGWKEYNDGISTKMNSDLKGFLNGGTYFFRVSASASNATGEWTQALEIVIPSAPTTDLDGNGQSDLLVVNSAGVTSGMVLDQNGKVTGFSAYGNQSPWQLAASGDFDGNGVTDLVWRNPLTSANDIWLMESDGKVKAKEILKSDKDDKIEATGDFNGDNMEDIVWRNLINGQNKISFMNGTSSTQVVFLGGNLDSRLVAISPRFDANKDGKTDLIWRDRLGGYRLWNMDGPRSIMQFPLTFLVGQEVVGGDDLDGDGWGDIIGWNSQTKQFSVYFLNRGNLTESNKLGISSGSIVVGSDDLNHDGVSDLIWQTTDGTTVVGFFGGRRLDKTIALSLPSGTVVARRPGRFVGSLTINPPDSPRDIKAIPGNGQVVLNWLAPQNNGGTSVTDYIIQYMKSSSSSYVTFADGVNATTTATINGLTNGQEYSFIVFAVNAAGKGPSSAPSPLIKPAGVPGQPTGLIAAPGDGKVFLDWVAPISNGGSSITDYLIQYRKGNEVSWTTFNDGVSTGTSATIDGLTNGSSYFFLVFAKNQVGTSQGSTPSGEVIPATVPSAPTGLQAVVGKGIVTLAWLAPSNNGGFNITDYVIQYRESGVGAWKTFNDGASASTSATVTGLANGTAYTFVASARNQVGLGGPSQESTPVVPETETTIKRVGAVPSGKRGTKTKFTVMLVDFAGSPVVNQPIYFFEFWNWNTSKNPPTYSKMVELNGKNPVYTDSNGIAVLSYIIPVNVNADNVRLLAKFNGVPGYRASSYEIVKVPIG